MIKNILLLNQTNTLITLFVWCLLKFKKHEKA